MIENFADTLEYIIDKEPKATYLIHKFLNGRPVAHYKIVKGRCNCLGGVYWNHCKHSQWIKQNKLPDNVIFSHSPSKKEIQKFLTERKKT